MNDYEDIPLPTYIEDNGFRSQRFICECLGLTPGHISRCQNSDEFYLRVDKSSGFIEGYFTYKSAKPSKKKSRLDILRNHKELTENREAEQL